MTWKGENVISLVFESSDWNSWGKAGKNGSQKFDNIFNDLVSLFLKWRAVSTNYNQLLKYHLRGDI